ncbi:MULTISPECIES: nitrate- and nitrite sensing domain-containing protein [Streptomyces]|uniref:histidine kinase n=1 Tax=Streptomyces koelreuteriae TaxID=2838015 RepID=A0ABX8G0A7_9ACTN|nr:MULTISPECIES: nitrate- and nitrite sensing domain-containing protein [Streptomyces]QWB26916.1 nitrate- and nitrite sensing domain-containing protein [Streptomyces koelreuteriae]UUA09996.1 nitrate- and nitrite sensing domain-containing protein [Streptomyces koelreuteriae]UUA17600.1 nitrate- and nitrite sensing domain-containing protein [Streptomyces sp. CRCS-T-1]
MRFRGKSIRRKIVALLLVPLVSLSAIWAFATVLTGREAADLFNVSSVVEKIGYPIEDTVRVLQEERRQTLVHLADPRASDGLAALRRSRTATDEAVAGIRENARNPDVRDAMGEDTDERLTAVLDAFEGIESLRSSVEDGTVNRSQALDLYNRLVDPCYVLLANLHVVDNVELDKQYRALVNLARARELLSREDALLGSALIVGRITHSEERDISDLVAQRTLMYDANLPLLPVAERDRYESFWKNASSAPLRVAEEAAVSSGSGAPRGVSAKSWDSAAGNVLDELGTLNDQANDRYQDRVDPVAMGVIAKAVIAGALGLLALLVSLFLSVRVGRTLIRDLRQLRLEAHEASGVRLPSVMRRLSAGEQVDVETEVPHLEYDKNEMGEVGQALNTLQRAAVEAAVKQAELRAGVSEVFVNLARRSQVLLHRQLTLLDAMERRTEDTEELADLFRIDHLTTRMRRHAEGLVILSGAAPSRQWRKPVQLMDVVRAAVAEVEDYERIEVRRLPRIAVTGPAVADLTHLVAELLENATVFSPPHTAVQVLGERVANGFTLEIHDRGLGMAAEALLDANLRLAETPEFELSDTDRLGLFVVSRLAQRQNVRVSLQPSPYGGTTAVVFIPDALLTDDIPDTNGIGFRLDRPQLAGESEPQDSRRAALSQAPAQRPGLPASLLDGPVELEAPVDLDAISGFSGSLDDENGTLFRSRPSLTRAQDETAGRPDPQQQSDARGGRDRTDTDDELGAPAVPPRRHTPKLVSSHGRPVTEQRPRRGKPDEEPTTSTGRADSGAMSSLPSRRRGEESASGRSTGRSGPEHTLPVRRRTENSSTGTGRDEARTDAPPPLPARRRGSESARPAIGAVGRGADHAEPPATPGSAVGEGPEPPALPKRTRRAEIASSGPDTPDHRPGPTRESSGRPTRGQAGSGAAPQDTGTAPGSPLRGAGSGTTPLPRRVRQANLAPQLKRGTEPRTEDKAEPVERDAEEVRSRMASLQRGWQRGRDENAAGDAAHSGAARQGTTEGDGR